MIHSIRIARVGILVEKQDSKYIPYTSTMFHCRQRDPGDAKHCPLSDWAADEVSMLGYFHELPGWRKLKVGETARYWVHMRMTHTSDYWGEHDTSVEILKCRRIK